MFLFCLKLDAELHIEENIDIYRKLSVWSKDFKLNKPSYINHLFQVRLQMLFLTEDFGDTAAHKILYVILKENKKAERNYSFSSCQRV